MIRLTLLSIETSPTSALRAPRDDAERALEAGRVADREQLLGVGAAALAAHLGRQPQLHVELAVGGLAVTLLRVRR